MQTLINHQLILLVTIFVLIVPSCKKQEPLLYQINTVEIQSAGVIKTKFKSSEQWVSILYANLFQRAMSGNNIFKASSALFSIGDKELAREVLISNFMNQSDVLTPSDTEMRVDIDKFIEETYARFLVRRPSEAEKLWFKNYIESDPNVSAELVYFSFALSNEYLFY